MVAGTTSDPSTVTTQKAAITEFINGGTGNGQLFTLTTGLDTVRSTGANDVINGLIGTRPGSSASESTLNAGDTLSLNGGTINVADVTAWAA